MENTIARAVTPASSIAVSSPSFLGIIRGEIFKVSRMWVFWIALVLLIGIACFPYIIIMSLSSQATALKNTPLHFFYNSAETNLFVLRVFIGFFLIMLTANVFGREYQAGTIRILLGRGIGRLQLFFAKLLAVVILALLVFVGMLILNVLLQFIQMLVLAGNTDGLSKLDGTFWNNIWMYLGTVLISMAITVLLTVATSAIGRSLSFGLSAALAFFPADNIGIVFMRLGFRLTHNDFWNNATAYFLGPNLNAMAASIAPQYFSNPASGPLVTVDGTHTLLVALGYAVVFAVVSIILTWKRDVKE
ncbi:ABC transporter permease [Tengunoibacter tsumagoiensis]|uniref:ABC transporter permease n=1 Tax=Tengunoibacter tsumagoiensis TaxID=2014871 RepID=A0A402A3J7_9CHLR|nr:ABC transporter permease [Tengunoibacter tsumagoiensis]GCE13619.1 hypothetical protein KTT_34780 [Tengunoibacter tsumagoiensis]